MAVEIDEKLQAIEAEDAEMDIAEKSEDEINKEAEEYQGDVFNALMAAANYDQANSERYLIRIRRPFNGKLVVLLKFHIHPLSEETVQQIRNKNKKVKRDRRYGIDREKVNAVRFRSQLIYEATDATDRDKIWNNRQAWEKLNVLNGIDLIDKVLLAGEKETVIEKIESISGFANDDELEELVKN